MFTSVGHAAVGAQDKTYVDDVFSAYVYTGNGSTQTITNGIDLSTYGGMVWIKSRSNAVGHRLYDSARSSFTDSLRTDTTGAASADGSAGLTASSTGYSLGSGNLLTNENAYTYTSWTFRKAAKFFDVVTWVGDSTTNRAIAHNLGVVPGMIIIKGTNQSGTYWRVWHRSLSSGQGLFLNTTDAAASTSDLGTTWQPTSSVFYVGSGTSGMTNSNSAYSYIAYLFAHDTATDGIIQCGSFTTDGSGNATVNLGWEPQYVLYKKTTTGSWLISDTMRGATANATSNVNYLLAESSGTEAAVNWLNPTASGFAGNANGAGTVQHIYLAIRRPNKPPTSGTQVFAPDLASSSGLYTADAGFPVDLWFEAEKAATGNKWYWFDRLRGGQYLGSQSTASESATAVKFDSNTSVFGTSSGDFSGWINYLFRRAPGVFDVVAFTDGAISSSVPHNLGVAPELVILKKRSATDGWYVITPTYYLYLNTTAAKADNTTSLGATTMNLASYTSTGDFIAYLFATKAGISKVGSYTGNGGNQNIECGFTAGARFILIKRTDNTGEWFVWDTARGINAGADPYLMLNRTYKEDDHNGDGTTTASDSIDPYNPGFNVVQDATTNINVNLATYIFLAFA